jgi:hypothetical protein
MQQASNVFARLSEQTVVLYLATLLLQTKIEQS